MTGSGRLTDTTDPTGKPETPNLMAALRASIDEAKVQREARNDPAGMLRAVLSVGNPERAVVVSRPTLTAAADEIESLRAQLAAARRTEAETKADRAAALREAANEVHIEARWQTEQQMRGMFANGERSIDRLVMLERILLDRAASLLAQPETPEQCCDLHGRNCEPPSELCCDQCTEFHHGLHADPPRFDRTLSSHHDGSTCSAPDLSGFGPALVLPEESTTEPNRANPKQES